MSRSGPYGNCQNRLLSVVRRMIETLDKIIQYIIDDIYFNEEDYKNKEGKERERLVNWIEKHDLSFKIGITPHELRRFRRNINKLKEIRKVYQQGLSFFKNKTKGFKKGYRNLLFTLLQDEIKRGNIDYAKERAENHLDYIKKYKSERTYYRHKKILKEDLGIEI